jgi:hypothetical protein
MEFIEHKTENGSVVEVQKFSNYRVQLIVVGELSHYTSQSLKEFILESNKGHQVNFVSKISDIL